MGALEVVALALIQALTEFLPVSSSAHLVLARWLLGWTDPGLAFDVALHVGTLLALTAYFAPTWIRILGLAAGRRLLTPGPDHPDRDLYRKPGLLWYLVAATLPAATAGLVLKDVIETHLRGPRVIGWMLVGVGCLIWWADRRSRLRKGLDQLSFPGAMAVGCAQALALVPGTSRSGITIAAGLLLGLERRAAAQFSFLLAMPAVLGAGLKTASDLLYGAAPTAATRADIALGIAVSAVSGYAVIKYFLRYLQTSNLAPFVYYRLGIGLVVLGAASNLGQGG